MICNVYLAKNQLCGIYLILEVWKIAVCFFDSLEIYSAWVQN